MSSAARPAAGGGRWVEVDPARLPRWLAGFAARHGGEPAASVLGEPTVRGEPRGAPMVRGRCLLLVAPDGASAELHAPPGAPPPHAPPAAPPPPHHAPPDVVVGDGVGVVADFVEEAVRARRLGLLLARQAHVAAGVADGERLVASKVDSSYVQARTAAGGWSQQRFARRRANQARAAAGTAADLVAKLLVPEQDRLDALVTGGDRRTIEAILADRRLAGLAALRVERFLDVAEPRFAVLEQAAVRARAVLILVRDAAPAPASGGPPG